MTDTILVLTAVADELKQQNAPDNVEVVYTGVGKVNAASITTQAVIAMQPRLVVNYGTAGKIHKMHSGLVEVAHVIQRDMDTMPLAPRGQTLFAPELDKFSSGHGTVTCGTGDSFVSAVDPWLVENNVDIVDMELYAIAHVCTRLDLPWRAFKFITDDADGDAPDRWQEKIADGEHLFWAELDKIRQTAPQ